MTVSSDWVVVALVLGMWLGEKMECWNWRKHDRRPFTCYSHRAGYPIEWVEIDCGRVCRRCGKWDRGVAR